MRKRLYKIVILTSLLAVPAIAQSQIYAKLNVLYATVGLINPQLEFVVAPHSSISIDPMISPYKTIKWGNRNDIHALFGIFQTEYRYYIKSEAQGFYLSANVGMQAFDITRPYLFQNKNLVTFEQGFGRGFGVMAGIGIGYSHRFKERWVVDAFFAFNRMWSWYNDYDAEGKINMYPRHQKEPKFADPFNGSAEWLPSKIGVSIGYMIFNPAKAKTKSAN